MSKSELYQPEKQQNLNPQSMKEGLSEDVNMPYQTLINSFLTDCVTKKKKPEIVWDK